MLKYLIILLISLYVWSILDKIIKFIKITSCIDTLSAFLRSTSPSPYGHCLVGDNYKNQLDAVLAKYPDICEFASLYSDTLRYGESDYMNYVSSSNLYNDLFMQRNFLRKEIFTCLNPINAVKLFVSLPSSIIQLLGFQISPSVTKVLNLVAWFIAYLLGMYEDEIKALINSLLKFL